MSPIFAILKLWDCSYSSGDISSNILQNTKNIPHLCKLLWNIFRNMKNIFTSFLWRISEVIRFWFQWERKIWFLNVLQWKLASISPAYELRLTKHLRHASRKLLNTLSINIDRISPSWHRFSLRLSKDIITKLFPLTHYLSNVCSILFFKTIAICLLLIWKSRNKYLFPLIYSRNNLFIETKR